MIKALYTVQWTEFERGWGQRPDGISFHQTYEDAQNFVADYLKKNRNEIEAPDEYSAPGQIQVMEVSQALFDYVTTCKNNWWAGGIRSADVAKTYSGPFPNAAIPAPATIFDWHIVYQFEGDDSDVMSVFGVRDINIAIEEAKSSLILGGGKYMILAVTRADLV